MPGPTRNSAWPSKPRADWTRRSTTTRRPSGSTPTTPGPTSSWVTPLRAKGRLDEAYDHYRQGLRLDPKNWEVLDGLTRLLLRLGRGAEAQATWRKVLDANPPAPRAWFGYAELC